MMELVNIMKQLICSTLNLGVHYYKHFSTLILVFQKFCNWLDMCTEIAVLPLSQINIQAEVQQSLLSHTITRD
jgi:hypothetical protein